MVQGGERQAASTKMRCLSSIDLASMTRCEWTQKYISFVLYRLEEIPGPWKWQRNEIQTLLIKVKYTQDSWKKSNISKIVFKKSIMSEIVEKSQKKSLKTTGWRGEQNQQKQVPKIMSKMSTVNKMQCQDPQNNAKFSKVDIKMLAWQRLRVSSWKFVRDGSDPLAQRSSVIIRLECCRILRSLSYPHNEPRINQNFWM